MRRGMPATRCEAGDCDRDVAMKAVGREEVFDDAVTNPWTAERQQDVDVPELVELPLRHPPAYKRVALPHHQHALLVVEVAEVDFRSRVVRRRNRHVHLA